MDALIKVIVRVLKVAQAEMDIAILATPTGSVRDRITEANIHLMLAIKVLEGIE